jgi:Flp pilus assembly protein TadG
MKRGKKDFLGNDAGAVAVYTAIGLMVFLGFAALALDMAHLASVKRELVKAAEAGALSGARGLWPVDLVNADSRESNWSTGESKAIATAIRNPVNGSNLITDEVTAEAGRWDYATKTFTPGDNTSANGVRVTTRRNNIPMILAQVLGQGPRDLSASAIAVMDFVGQIGAGCLPIAVNKDYAYKHQGLYINFTPDPSDNAGWFTDPPDSASAKTIKDYIDNAACDPLHIGDIINLQNGNDASCLQDLKNKLAAVVEAGGNWIVCLPVVNTDTFNQDTPIANFVSFKITQVTATGSDKGVTGDVLGLCEFQNALPGGGSVGGALAPPKLVQ